ncbi:MAG: hypothetical protein GY734_14780 [Herbaspirillum sp.]|nr:hypothetical protein [Herbaspirillum sp.]
MPLGCAVAERANAGWNQTRAAALTTCEHLAMRPCSNCQGTSFVDEKCEFGGRPRVPDTEYFDAIEGLAWEVVNAAYDEFGEHFSLAETGDSPIEQAIIRLGVRLRHYHYDGDGCIDGSTAED